MPVMYKRVIAMYRQSALICTDLAILMINWGVGRGGGQLALVFLLQNNYIFFMVPIIFLDNHLNIKSKD
jgi:hypothetical protein